MEVLQKGLLLRRTDYLNVDDNANAHPNRHLYFRRATSPTDIIDACNAKLQAEPMDANILFERGVAQMQAEEYAGAIADFTSCIQMHGGELLQAHFYRGHCFEKIDKVDEAIDDYTTTLELDPLHTQAAYARGSAHNKRGDFTAAILDYEMALSHDKNNQHHAGTEHVSARRPRKSKFAITRSKMSQSPQHRGHSISQDGTANSQSQGGITEEGNNEVQPRSPDATPMRNNALDSSSMREPPKLQSSPPSNSMAASTPMGRQRKANFNMATPSSAARDPAEMQLGSQTPQVGTAEYHHSQGFACRKAGDLHGAIREYTLALAFDPKHFKAYFNRGFCYDKLGDYDASIADYTSALQIEPNNAFTYYNLGISYDRQGDGYKKAVEMFTRAIELDSTNPDFFHNRGFSRRKMGQYREAITDYTKAIELDGKHFKAYYNRAFSYDKLQDYTRAVQDYTKALQIDPRNANAYHNRGSSHEKLGALLPAVEDFTAAIQLDPSNASTFNARGLVYDRLERFDEALQDFASAITLQRNNAVFFHNKGFTHRNKGEYEAAINEYSIAISLNPRSAAAYNNRGFAERKIGLYDLAVQDYTKSLELNPNNIRTLNNRGYSYARLGLYDLAAADYDKVLSMDRNNVHAFHNRGISYDKKGDHRAAISDFTKVIELDPSNYDALYHRASSYESIGDVERSYADYKSALEVKVRRCANAAEVEAVRKEDPAALAMLKLKQSRAQH